MLSVDQPDLYSKLFIQQIEPTTDVDDYMVWASDDKVSKYCSWEPCKSKEEAIEYINNNVVNHPYFRMVCLDNRPIGYVLLTFNAGNDKCRAELGYVLAARYWGRGIGTWAVKTVVSMIFEERPELERVEGFGSQKVTGKAGFVREGVLRKYYTVKGRTRDFIIFSFLRVDLP